ncbi:hypothetical protein H4582DRAFT_1390444 [Lactarius indigo]|nr:hypothetical protein H4582DRAFT_1390444 [Lactarius indigo]
MRSPPEQVRSGHDSGTLSNGTDTVTQIEICARLPNPASNQRQGWTKTLFCMPTFATVVSSNAALVANNIRISAISVTAYEYLLTLPAEYRFYRAFYRNNYRLSTSLVLFVLIRYIGLITGALGNWEFFSQNFTPESCRRLFLLPTIFRMFLSMVSQAIVGLRAYTISRKNQKVGIVLLSSYIFTSAVQWFAQIYNRVPVFINGTCGAASTRPTLFLSPWLFYLAGMFYDLLTLIISMGYLFKYHSSSPFTSRLVKMMIYDGLGYFVALTVVNTINAILTRTTNSILQVSGGPLGGLLTFIMSQRILINLQNVSEERLHTETPPYVHRSTHSLSAKDRPSSGDHHLHHQEGTELIQVRVDRSVVVGVGPWNAEPNDESCRKPEVKWDQGIV